MDGLLDIYKSMFREFTGNDPLTHYSDPNIPQIGVTTSRLHNGYVRRQMRKGSTYYWWIVAIEWKAMGCTMLRPQRENTHMM